MAMAKGHIEISASFDTATVTMMAHPKTSSCSTGSTPLFGSFLNKSPGWE